MTPRCLLRANLPSEGPVKEETSLIGNRGSNSTRAREDASTSPPADTRKGRDYPEKCTGEEKCTMKIFFKRRTTTNSQTLRKPPVTHAARAQCQMSQIEPQNQGGPRKLQLREVFVNQPHTTAIGKCLVRACKSRVVLPLPAPTRRCKRNYVQVCHVQN